MAVLLTDLDGTLTAGSTWRGFRSYYEQHHSRWRYRLFFYRWMPRYLLIKAGLLSDRIAKVDWIEDEITLMRGTAPAAMDQVADWILERQTWPGRRQDVLAEIEERRSAGARVLVVTGAYQPLADAFASKIGGQAIGTPLNYQDGQLVGLGGPVNAYEQKEHNIRALVGDEPILAAYGDSTSDLAMLELAAEPVAVYPNPALAQIAADRGWRIVGQRSQ